MPVCPILVLSGHCFTIAQWPKCDGVGDAVQDALMCISSGCASLGAFQFEVSQPCAPRFGQFCIDLHELHGGKVELVASALKEFQKKASEC